MEALAPDLPLVGAGRGPPPVPDAGEIERGMRLFIAGVEAISGAAADPEKPDLAVGYGKYIDEYPRK